MLIWINGINENLLLFADCEQEGVISDVYRMYARHIKPI